MNYVKELTRSKIINDLKHYYDESEYINLSDIELNIFFKKHINNNSQEIEMKDFYELKDKNILVNSLDGFVKVGKKIKKEQLKCFTLTLVDNRKLSGAFNHLVETERGWVSLENLNSKDYVLTTDGFIKVKNTRQIKTQDVYDLECLHVNHRYLSNGISNHNTGKSFAAMMVIDYLMKNNKNAKFDLITNSKILQTQYTDDFDFLNNLWGANNYTCSKYECSCETGKELAKINKIKCEDCPYDDNKEWYFGGQIGLTNYHMFILYNLFLPHLYEARDAKILIVDEAHELEVVMADFVSIKVSKPILKMMGVPQHTLLKHSNKFKSVKSMDQFVDLLENELIPDLEVYKKSIRKSDLTSEGLKRLERLEGNLTRYNFFIEKQKQDSNNWVIEIEDNKHHPNKNMKGVTEIIIQPVWSGTFLKEYIWAKYDHVIMMSGTILDKDMFCYLNGFEEEDTAYLSMDMPFPKENRKIYYMPVAKMNYSNKHQAIEMYIPMIKKILKKNIKEKGIIHTVNYEIANWIKEKINDDRLIFHDTSTRDAALRQHYNSEEPTVLVSPSMFTGVDLKDDLSRFQMILKMPFPNLGSKKIMKRKDSLEAWYGWRTVADIVQSYGRSVRNYDDYATTWILDASFDNVLNYSGYYFPKWFHEAIYKVNV